MVFGGVHLVFGGGSPDIFGQYCLIFVTGVEVGILWWGDLGKYKEGRGYRKENRNKRMSKRKLRRSKRTKNRKYRKKRKTRKYFKN